MATFRDLHYSDAPLLLPNAWDLGSALAFVEAGFTVVATTSFGVAACKGTPDGGRSTRADTLALASELRRLPVYVTTDIEDGYSDSPEEVADFVASLVNLGVAGVNVEDSKDGRLVDPKKFAAKVGAIKRRSPDVFVNARVDNIWFAEDATVDAVLARAALYAEAGADGIFVPGLADPADIRSIAAGIRLPLNVLPHPSLAVAALGELGVRRVSSGSLPYRAAVDAAVNSVTILRDGGVPPVATSYADMQSMLSTFDQR